MPAGAGEAALALAVTGCVAFVKLALRPLSRLLDRTPLQTTGLARPAPAAFHLPEPTP